MATNLAARDRGRSTPVARRVLRLINDAFRAGATKDEEEFKRLKEDAEEMTMDPPADAEVMGDPDEGDNHLHVHVHAAGGDKPPVDAGETEAAKPAADPASGTEVAGALAALQADIADIKDTLAEIADVDAEESGLEEEEGEGEEVADRRRSVRDRRVRARDRMRGWRTRDAELVQTLETDPADAGKTDLPGTGPGENRVVSEPVHDRRRTRDGATMDSRGMKEAFAAVLAKAEILVPGIRLPVFDAAVPAKKTADRLCAFRRRALDAAYLTPAGRAAIDELTSDQTLDVRNATCDAITTLFNGASAMIGASNTRALTGNGVMVRDGNRPQSMSERIAEINKKNRERKW